MLDLLYFGYMPGSEKIQKSVLVVEDDLELEPLYSEIINSCDKNVNLTWTTSAERAVRELKRKPYDLIIADHLLPGHTGMDLWRYCKQKKFFVPFVLVSGCRLQFGSAVDNEEVDWPTFFRKPIPVKELADEVQNALKSP
jgi:DNA-binding NtrC family response regulator